MFKNVFYKNIFNFDIACKKFIRFKNKTLFLISTLSKYWYIFIFNQIYTRQISKKKNVLYIKIKITLF